MMAPWDVGVWVVNSISDLLQSVQNTISTFRSVVTTGGVPIVRHVQRGIVETDNHGEATITLTGFTNANKMVVDVSGVYAYGGASDRAVSIYIPQVTSLTATELKVDIGTNDSGIDISYQVIEFY